MTNYDGGVGLVSKRLKLLAEPTARDMPDLLERAGDLGIGVVRNPPFHFGDDRIAGCMPGERDDHRKAEFLPVAAIDVADAIELGTGQRREAEAPLPIITPFNAFCAFSSGISSICRTTGWSAPSICPEAMRNKSE